MRRSAINDKNLLSTQKDFNLQRYFSLSSIAIILILTAILSFVLVVRQKNQMINLSKHMVIEAAHQLNHHIIKEFTFSVTDRNGYQTIDSKRINYDNLLK